MPAKKVALFVDVETLHHQLRSLHHRLLDPKLLLETAASHGKLVASVAIADWTEVPADSRQGFTDLGVETVQIDRLPRGREQGGRRREVLRDLVDLELLARIVERLFNEGGPEVARIVVATGDEVAARAIGIVRERFHKDVHVIGVEGASAERLQEVASSWEALPMPPVEPQDLAGLEKLVPLLEDLERRKRYLNFKYIRETVVRRLDLAERSFEASERLLSEAIACGLLLKQKVEDKYNPGQLFTAYALDRSSELFERFGSGEPAPIHDDAPPPSENDHDDDRIAAPAMPSMGSRNGKARQTPAPASPSPAAAADADGPGKRKRRRRRRRNERAPVSGSAGSSGSSGNGASAPAPANGHADPEVGPPIPMPGGGGGGGGKGRRNNKRGGPHNQDRVGRSYEAPSRFIADAEELPHVDDDEIDEEQILRARGDHHRF